MKGDGTVVAWGENGSGQRNVPAGLSDVSAVAAGYQHTAALKQYQLCERTLRRELGVDPQPETRSLYKQIRR